MVNTTPNGENVAKPICMTEAYSCLREMRLYLDRIKTILAAQGLWNPPPFSGHDVPLTEGELFTACANSMQDINLIKQVLLDNNFTFEGDFIPITARWRIDGAEHAHRQFATFDAMVRQIIEEVNAGKPPRLWKPKENEVDPSR